MTDHNEPAAASRPAQTTAARLPPIGRAEINKLARVIAKELGQALRRLDKIEAACGLSKSTAQPGTEAIAPVIKNFIEARLASIEQLIFEHDNECLRVPEGAFKPGKTYKRGQTVSFRGGVWAALGATDTSPPSGDWKLVVKSGAFGPRGDETRKSADDET